MSVICLGGNGLDGVCKVFRDKEQRTAGRQIWPAIVCLSVVSACSVNDLGFVDTKTFDAVDASVMSVDAVGIHVDARFRAFSLSVGHYQASYLLPNLCENRTSERRHSVMNYSRLLGVQVLLSHDEISFTLGFRETMKAALREENGRMASTYFDFRDVRNSRYVLTERNQCDV